MPWYGQRYSAALEAAAAEGLTLAAEYLRSESVALTPLRDGPLRGSAGVTPATAATLEAVVFFDTPYAVIQHEALDFHHSDGQPKYLEAPLIAHQSRLLAIINAPIARIGGLS